jgi:heme/copper-type cytochrome/quinol oxidase subunit 4
MTFAGIVQNIVVVVNFGVVPLLYALAIIYLFIAIVRFFFIETGPEAQEKGKKSIMYGIIGIVVIFSVWGLVNILLNTLNSVAGTSSTATTTQAF